jgi:dihydroorotase
MDLFTLVKAGLCGSARRETIQNRRIASRCGWTPYDGEEVQGWPVGTIVRGRRVMWEGELLAPGQGQPVRFGQVS